MLSKVFKRRPKSESSNSTSSAGSSSATTPIGVDPPATATTGTTHSVTPSPRTSTTSLSPIANLADVTSDCPLGLLVLREPPSPRNGKVVNIIFVHGLRGSAIGTWTHSQTKQFWPAWLHEQKGLDDIRIAVFGYKANFANVFASETQLGISQFADQLLNLLDLHYRKYGNVDSPINSVSDFDVGTHHSRRSQHGWISR